MSRDYAVFLGDVAKDEYYETERFPRNGEKIGVSALPIQYGGMIANAACVYARLGGRVKFLSSLNPGDQDLCQELGRQGIDTSLVSYDPQVPPSKCVVLLSEGEHTVLIVSMEGVLAHITEETQKQLCKAKLIYSNYFELGRLRCGQRRGEELVRQWRENGVRLICDIDVDTLVGDNRRFLPYTDILLMNKVGLRNLLDSEGADTEQEAVDKLLETGVSMVIATLAEDGCRIYEKDRLTAIPGVPAQVRDVTGAGDTFGASFAYVYGLTGNGALAGSFANCAASRSVTILGARAGACKAETVLKYMEDNGISPEPYGFLSLDGRYR